MANFLYILLSLVQFLVTLVSTITIPPGSPTTTKAPVSPKSCLFGDGNYTVGETWHPFLIPDGYVCLKCSCNSLDPAKDASVSCYRAHGKCCSTCSGKVAAGTHKFKMCTNQRGQIYSHSSVWSESPKDPNILKPNQCMECSCWDDFITCAIRNCPKLSCKNPWPQKGTCCKTCSLVQPSVSQKKGCYSMARFYEIGSVWHPQIDSYFPKCLQCKCEKTGVKCERLKCPYSKCANLVRLHPGDCCKVCLDNGNKTTSTNQPVTSPTIPGVQVPFPNCTRMYINKVFANGSYWHPTITGIGKIKSVICHCLNGNIMCKKIKCQPSHNCSHLRAPTRRSTRSQPCTENSYWRVMLYVNSQPTGQFTPTALRIKFALVKYPLIEFYMVKGENTPSPSWVVNRWKVKTKPRLVDVIKTLNSVSYFQGGHFKESGVLRNGEQRDELRQLMFKRCSSHCAEKVKQVENYLKHKTKTTKKRLCRSIPSVPRALQMLTSDGR